MGQGARSSWGRLLADLGSTLLEVVHGRIPADRPVGGVVIHDPVDEPVYPENSLVLAVGVHTPDALAPLLTGAGRNGGIAVIVRSPVDLTDDVRRAADDAGVAILGLARGATWTQLAALLRSMLAEDDIGHTQAESLDGIPAGDLFAVANAISALLDAPVTIEDRSSRVLAFSGRQDEADASRIETIIGRQVPDRYAQVLVERGVFRDLYQSDRPVVVDPIEMDEVVTQQRVAIAVRAGDEVLGSIWAAMDGPVTPERAATLREAETLVALHLLRVRAGADAERRLRAELVSRAVEGGPEARDALSRLGLAGRRVSVIAAAALPDEDGDASEQADQERMAARELLLDALTMHLSAVQPGAAVAFVADTAYGIIPVADAAAEDRSAALSEDFVRRISGRIPAVVAIGHAADDVAGIAASRAEARRVLRVLTTRAGTRRVARMADVETESLLLELRDLRASRGETASGFLARLVDYDRRTGSELVNTLAAWLDNFGDVPAAAAATFLHPNTFRYRLRRVAEVGEIDLTDGDTRFAAMLQLRIRRD
ncbi:PucR family transcriptional regulator [Microbacterium sp. RD1]|uniref:PucR family transcriptional regulator n=1 Tax=Microbacterium sp. RD1 TaxID=3457313 RepID=UPI003FA53EA8